MVTRRRANIPPMVPLFETLASGRPLEDQTQANIFDTMPVLPPKSQGEQTVLMGIQPVVNQNLANLRKKGAIVSAMFPGYWGIDPEIFRDVTEEAYRQSDPKVLVPKLYKKTDLSLSLPEHKNSWVLFPAGEYNRVLDYPEAYSRRVDALNRTQPPSLYRKDQTQREKTASRAGAHALESWVAKMQMLLAEYTEEIATLRALQKLIPLEFHALGLHVDNRKKLQGFRDRLSIIMQTFADVEGWSTEELRLARLGADMRLMAGHGRERLQAKKRDWSNLFKGLGNHAIAKKVVVRDRSIRANAEYGDRMRRGQAS